MTSRHPCDYVERNRILPFSYGKKLEFFELTDAKGAQKFLEEIHFDIERANGAYRVLKNDSHRKPESPGCFQELILFECETEDDFVKFANGVLAGSYDGHFILEDSL